MLKYNIVFICVVPLQYCLTKSYIMLNYFILEQVYTIETAAELLKCNDRVLRENVRSGLIKGYKKLGKWYLLHSDIIKFITSESNEQDND